MQKPILGLVAASILTATGFMATGAKAVPAIPAMEQPSIADNVRWRPRVIRPARRTVRLATRPVRRVVRPVPRVLRPWRW